MREIKQNEEEGMRRIIMRNKKFICLLCCLAAGAVFMTGCGSSKTAASSSNAALTEPKSYGKVTKLGNYKGISLTVDSTVVTDEEVTEQVNQRVTADTTTTEVDRAAQKGDVLNIDFVGKIDGKEFDNGSATGFNMTIGSGKMLDGFEDGLIGSKKGDKKTLNLAFPADYKEADLAGKDVVFEVTVNSVSESKSAVLSDEWVNTYTKGEETTVAAYRDKMRSDLEESKKKSAESNAENEAIQKVIDSSEFKLQDSAVAYALQEMKKNVEAQITQYAAYGITRDLFLQYNGLTEETLLQEEQKSAENSAKQIVLVKAIAKKENMKLEDADYKLLENLTGQTKAQLVSSAGQSQVDQVALYYKVAKFIYDNASKTTAETTAASAETTAASGVTESSSSQ